MEAPRQIKNELTPQEKAAIETFVVTWSRIVNRQEYSAQLQDRPGNGSSIAHNGCSGEVSKVSEVDQFSQLGHGARGCVYCAHDGKPHTKCVPKAASSG